MNRNAKLPNNSPLNEYYTVPATTEGSHHVDRTYDQVETHPPPLPTRRIATPPRYSSDSNVTTSSSASWGPGTEVVFEHSRQTYHSPLEDTDLKRFKKGDTICLNFDPPEDDLDSYQTDVGRLLIEKTLPFSVRVRDDCYDGSMTFAEGTVLSLHFIHRQYRVYATDTEEEEYHLPIYARQLYAILPADPVHDDKTYRTTLELIKARPLPRRVRIEEAHFSDHPGEAQECGDIIEIEKIERRPVPEEGPIQLCVVGTCNKYPVAFSESMNCASYSTMPSIDFMSISEIVKKFPLPLRVRKADNPAFVMTLHRLDEEYHVVATCANSSQVLSIPVTWEGKIEVFESDTEHLLRSLLPPLYPLVNTTWGLKEPGRRELQPNMQQVAQPLQEILESWSRTQEGREFVLKASEASVDHLKNRIEELMEEKARLNNELKLYRVDAPPPPQRADMLTKKPVVPPRIKSPTSPTAPQQLEDDSGDYEEPLPVQKKGMMHVKSTKEREELKAILETRESENKQLRGKIKRLEGENRVLDGKNASLVEEIRKLQGSIDQLMADPMYDTLDTSAPGYVNPVSGPLYGERGNLAKPSTLESLDERAVSDLLREMKLEKYVGAFKENAVNGELLANLDEEDLYGELGMGRLHAKRLLIEVKKRKK